VIAVNKYGNSEISLSGNGAKILTYPGAPYDLKENTILRTADSITFTWTVSEFNGGF